MSRTIDFIKPLRLGRLTHLIRVQRVDGSVHWSVLLIAAVILFSAVRQPLVSLMGLSAYIGILLIHESGHLIAAQRRGCQVSGIELYPIYGITRFQTPWSRYDHCMIAWGGVLAQLIVAVPLILWVVIFGYTPFDSVNAVLAILGFFNLGIALFNLLPIAPLDGFIAWELIPALFNRARKAPKKSHDNRGSWR
jgi:Zn-dependent protease